MPPNPDLTPDSPLSFDTLRRNSHLPPTPLAHLYDHPDDPLGHAAGAAVHKGEMKEIDALKLYVSRGLGRRSEEHILRLLQRTSPAELTFGRDLCRWNIETVFDPEHSAKMDLHDIGRVTEGENTDTQVYWTFAPYIYQQLIVSGLSQASAMRLTLMWAKDGHSYFGRRGKRANFGKIHLQGLEFLNDVEGFVPYGLDADPNHLSHAYTLQEAQRIAALILSREEASADHSFEAPDESLLNVCDYVRCALRQAEAIGVYSDEEVLGMLRGHLALKDQDRWHILAVLRESYTDTGRIPMRVSNMLISGSKTLEDKGAFLQQLPGWHQRHVAAVNKGLRPYDARELDQAITSLRTVDDPWDYCAQIEAQHPLSGSSLEKGVLWSSQDYPTVNISKARDDWCSPFIQLYNRSNGWLGKLTGWLFKVQR